MKKKGKSMELLLGSSLFSFLLMFLIRIPLSRIIGDMGMGYFSVGIEIVTVCSIGLSFGLARAVTSLVKYYVRRNMFVQAGKVYRSSVTLTMVITIPLSIGMILFAEQAAKALTLEYLGYMALAAAAPMICFSSLAGVMRGYFQGMGSMVPTMHSRLLERLIMAGTSLLAAVILYQYGIKVADLLKYTRYSAAYGAMGACLGGSIAGGISVVHLLLIHVAYRPTFRQRLKQQGGHSEKTGSVLPMLVTAALPHAVYGILYNLHFLVDQRIFHQMMNGKAESGPVFWGAYYGKYSTVIGIAGVLCAMAGLKGIQEIGRYFERQDTDTARRKLKRTVHYLSVFSFPFAVFIAVLAEPVANVFFSGTQKTAIELLRMGSGAVVFFSFSYVLMGVLIRIRRIYMAVAVSAAAFLIHLLVLFLLLANTGLGIQAVVWSMMIFWLVNAAAGMMLLMKYMEYRPRLMRSFILPLFSSLVAGSAGLLLCKLLGSVLGNALILLVGIGIGLVIYNLILIAMKGLNREELEGMPGGKLILEAAERFRLI